MSQFKERYTFRHGPYALRSLAFKESKTLRLEFLNLNGWHHYSLDSTLSRSLTSCQQVPSSKPLRSTTLSLMLPQASTLISCYLLCSLEMDHCSTLIALISLMLPRCSPLRVGIPVVSRCNSPKRFARHISLVTGPLAFPWLFKKVTPSASRW